jgi:hypothetical protein
MVEEGTRICQGCGATIYSEHLDTGIAGYHGGKLLCPHCLEEAEAAADPTSSGEVVEDMAAISLVDEEPTPDRKEGETQIRSFGSESHVGGTFDDLGLDRAPNPDVAAATRCRTFHTKLNEGAVAFMNRQVNEWADADPRISIKFATSCIGIFEGKKADPHLILTVFY